MNKSIALLILKMTRVLPSTMYAKFIHKYVLKVDLNLKNPTTFNDKLWYLHLYNRNPLTTTCSDKVLVRDYVSKLGLGHILNDIYKVFDSPKDIDLALLPDEFFLKVNHLSDGNYWCHSKNEFDIKKIKKKFTKLFKKNYYWIGNREWNYKNITPKIICEKVLKDEESKIGLIDYRFFCFNGKVHFIAVDIQTSNNDGSHFKGAKRNVYDANFNKIDVVFNRKNFDEYLIHKPNNWDIMIKYAEILSKPFSQCRVDMYNINGKIIFGEITFHTGGSHNIQPVFYQKEWGDLIDISSKKNILTK